MVGLMAVFGGSGTYGLYGYYQPNQWAMAGEMAGSSASGQFGGLGQQMIGNGLNRPPTIEIPPGYQLNVMVLRTSCSGFYTANRHQHDKTTEGAMGVLKRRRESEPI